MGDFRDLVNKAVDLSIEEVLMDKHRIPEFPEQIVRDSYRASLDELFTTMLVVCGPPVPYPYEKERERSGPFDLNAQLVNRGSWIVHTEEFLRKRWRWNSATAVSMAIVLYERWFNEKYKQETEAE